MDGTTETADSVAKGRESIQRRGFQHPIVRVLEGFFTTPRGWWLISIAVAAIEIWPVQHRINPDGLSYLDIAVQASKGDLAALVNLYWSPAYPALAGALLFLLRPLPAWEVPVLQLVNFFIFILALGAFTLFYRSWSTLNPEIGQASSTAKGLFTLFVFATFLRTTTSSMAVYGTTPDMLVATVIFLVAAMGCRISHPGAGWKHFVGLGVLLGAGMYVKAALFPLCLAFIGLLLISLWRTSEIPRRKQLAFVGASAAICFAVAAPIIIALSVQKGGLTTGETGKLNYMWYVDQFQPDHFGWTGGTAPEYGTPLHPPRVLIENPRVLEFATPVGGTFPLWYSPAYWYAGAKTVFNLHKQIATLVESFLEFRRIAIRDLGYVAGAVLLLVFSMWRGRSERPSRLSFWLLAWPLVAFAMYSLVYVESRYVAPFLLLLYLEIFRALVFRVQGRVAIAVCAIALVVADYAPARFLEASVVTAVEQFRHPVEDEYLVTADILKRLGLQPGDRLAVAGSGFRSYYAQYDGLRVVALFMNPDEYWQMNPAGAKSVEDRLASIGVKAIVAISRPASQHESGWIEAGSAEGRPFSVLLLEPAK